MSDHSVTRRCKASLYPGTKWLHTAPVSFPAAPAVRMWQSGSAAAPAPIFSARRREIRRLVVMVVALPALGIGRPSLRPERRGVCTPPQHLRLLARGPYPAACRVPFIGGRLMYIRFDSNACLAG